MGSSHFPEWRSVRARTIIRALAVGAVAATSFGVTQAAAQVPVPGTTEARKAAVRAATVARAPVADEAFLMGIYAYEDKPISRDLIAATVKNAQETETGNFRIAQLVRVLFLTNDTREYDSIILPGLKTISYWQTPGQSSKYIYYTENHMALWMSSAYLLRQREGWAMDSQLDTRLKHFLNLKIRYGFYEYNSKTYYSRTLGALLNLADFATDPVIKSLAEQAAQRLMRELMVYVTEAGALFPAAGRSDAGMYRNFRPHSLFWMATGRGPFHIPVSGAPGGNDDYAGQFVATTSVSLDEVGASWRSSIDTTISTGHPAADHPKIQAPLTRMDRGLFQWSAGSYAFPQQVFQDTLWLGGQQLSLPIPGLLLDVVGLLPLNNALAPLLRGTDNSDVTIKAYRNAGSALISSDREHGGYLGFEQMPWAATVDDVAVFTQSGPVGACTSCDQIFGVINNSHLPAVKQQSNVALISYYPKNLVGKLAFTWGIASAVLPLPKFNLDVSLYWPKAMDQTVHSGRWVIGRRNNSYVAVYRDQTTPSDVGYVSTRNGGRQVWASVVGNQSTHGSFDAFVNRVKQGKVTERHYFDIWSWQWKYDTKVVVDGKTISHTMSA